MLYSFSSTPYNVFGTHFAYTVIFDVAESTSFWINVFDDLKDRGVEKVLYMVSDGLAGIECAVKQAFDGVHYQRCVVHLVRNLKKYTTKSNCKSTLADFKNFYSSPNKELALENYNHFLENHKKSKNIIKHFKEYAEFIFPLFDIPVNIRNYIYTNNISESVNSKIKRGFYGRSALPNAEASLNIIFVNLIDLEQKWKNKKVNNWDNIFNELLIVHSDVISKYL